MTLQSSNPSELVAWQQQLRRQSPTLRARYGVQQLWLFGPHTTGHATPGTPLDMLAEIDGTLTYEQFDELQAELGRLLGVTVELVLKGEMPPDVAEIAFGAMVKVV